jgi:hypothetical protein
MTNSYMKLVSSTKIRTIEVSIDPAERVEGEDMFKNVAAQGYIGTHEVFFFDDRQPDSIRKAYDDALAANVLFPNAKLSIFRKAKVGGPWDSLPIVGEGLGDSVPAAPTGEEQPS